MLQRHVRGWRSSATVSSPLATACSAHFRAAAWNPVRQPFEQNRWGFPPCRGVNGLSHQRQFILSSLKRPFKASENSGLLRRHRARPPETPLHQTKRTGNRPPSNSHRLTGRHPSLERSYTLGVWWCQIARRCRGLLQLSHGEVGKTTRSMPRLREPGLYTCGDRCLLPKQELGREGLQR